MAKKTQRRPAWHERYQLGCMQGFISMFDFHHGRHAHKLLVERRHGSKRVSAAGNPSNNKLDKPECCHEVGEERNVTIAVIKPSVKKLIEQELVTDKEIKKDMDNSESGQVLDSELEDCPKKNQNFGPINAIDYAEAEVHCCNRNHQQSMRSLDIDNMIEDFCCGIHRGNPSHVKNKKLNQSHEDYKERLRELVKFLISQRILHGNHPREDSEILTSKDLMEVFQILGSDEGLFLKLLQDPDLLVPRDDQDLQNSENLTDLPAGRNQLNFFRMKNRPEDRIDHNICDSSDRIIILKPGPASLSSPEMGNSHSSSLEPHLKGQSEMFSSHFFLHEIKRKLKQAIRKGPPFDGGFGEGFRKSVPTKDHFFIEKMARSSIAEKKPLKVFKKHEDDDRKQRLSNTYIEAKKHLSEMLSNGDSNSTSKQVQRTLGRILSFPKCSSHLGSQGRKCEQRSYTAHRRSASADFPSAEGNKEESYESPQGHAMEDTDHQMCHFNDSDSCIEPLQPAPSELAEESVDKANGTRIKEKNSSDSADDVIIDKEIGITREEDNAISNALPDQGSPSMFESSQIDDDISKVEDHDEQREGGILRQSSLEESPPPPPPPPPGSSMADSLSNSFAKTEEPPDLPEWSSPVSVLESRFGKDDISPARTRSHSGEELVQPLGIQFEENDSAVGNQENCVGTTVKDDDKDLVFMYGTSILDAVDSDWRDLYLKSQSSDQLLEPALISNIPFCPNQLCSDHELLFDCINEVLLDFCSYPPWVSFYRPRTRIISSVRNIAHEVHEAVYWHLLPLPLPHALDDMIRKDMARAGNWLDVRDGIDCIGAETGELILDQLLEELVLNCMSTDAELEVDESILSL